MKAAVLYEQKTPLVVEDIELEGPQRGEVLVKLVAAGVCHSDLSFIEGRWKIQIPTVMGHEGAGVVEKVGEGVTSVQPGDHVIFSWVASCGVCRNCSRGKPYLCTNTPLATMKDGTTRFKKGDLALFHQTGVSSFSEYTVAHETSMVKIREDMPLDKAALISCGVITGVSAVINAAEVELGSSVAVFGCGGVGLNVIQGATLVGATKIIAVDVFDNKLALAKEFGATHTVNASTEDSVARIREITGSGADYAFEVIGIPEVVARAFDATDAAGTTVMVGMPPLRAPLTINTLGLFLGKTLKGAYFGSAHVRTEMPALVELYLEGRLKLDELISRAYPLEAINDAFDAMRNGEVARSIIKF
ncbi:MAG TPA: Zn-dependent alcohol dehydrogenase [Dehalococcoidia bacterium]|nr:Zn-dependent alcohol dehydrogenase [Dehalococcoidia bacterium]